MHIMHDVHVFCNGHKFLKQIDRYRNNGEVHQEKVEFLLSLKEPKSPSGHTNCRSIYIQILLFIPLHLYVYPKNVPNFYATAPLEAKKRNSMPST